MFAFNAKLKINCYAYTIVINIFINDKNKTTPPIIYLSFILLQLINKI